MRKFKHVATNQEFTTKELGRNKIEGIVLGDWEIPMWVLENGNDWEEIKEEEYTLLSWVDEKGGVYRNKEHVSTISGDGKFYITSVERLSDKKIFNVGDINIKVPQRIKDFYKHKTYKISSFYVDKGALKARVENGCHIELKDLEFDTALFITEDGVAIYGGESIYAVTDDFQLAYNSFAREEHKNMRVFFTHEAAEKYIEDNKPMYTLNDIEKAVNHWSMCKVEKENIEKFLGR